MAVLSCLARAPVGWGPLSAEEIAARIAAGEDPKKAADETIASKRAAKAKADKETQDCLWRPFSWAMGDFDTIPSGL